LNQRGKRRKLDSIKGKKGQKGEGKTISPLGVKKTSPANGCKEGEGTQDEKNAFFGRSEKKAGDWAKFREG